MTETVGFTCTLPRKRGLLQGVIARITAAWPKRSSRIRTEDWSDYMLRDIGLSSAGRNSTDRSTSRLDWPMR